jgi:outer membrane immunogenic protein
LKQSAFVFSLLAAAIAGTAPTQAPAQAQEPKPFQGLYFGLHGGYAWQNISGVFDNAAVPPTSLAPLDNDGAIVGAQLGYNVQYNWFMMGVEADASARAGSSNTVINNPQLNTYAVLSGDTNYLASIRGRVGFVAQDVLFYGTAGVAFSRYAFEENAPNVPFNGSLRFTDTSAVYGGGIEWKFAYGVSVRGEYLHYDTGGSSYIPSSFFNAASGDVVNFHDIDVARAGINISLGQ